MKFTASITADGSTAVCQIDRRRSDANMWQGSVFISGTFGSGTVKIQYSPDGGTTKFDAKDFTGTAMSATSASTFVTQPQGNGDKLSDYITVYATMSGSTNPAVTVTLFDNR